MKNKIILILQKIVNFIIIFLANFKLGKLFFGEVINFSMNRIESIKHNNQSLKFTVPNQLNQFRINTFSTKEPETLDWIDTIPPNSIIWDIGANIGLYSCYAASRGLKVFAFEPSIFNLELLGRNIFLNNFQDMITIIPLPLTDKIFMNKLNMSSTEWGGAMSSFGVSYGHDGKELKKLFEYSILGISMDDCVNLLKIPAPSYIKMDVDGIEHLILSGGSEVLRSIHGIIIEVNDEFQNQSEKTKKILEQAGLNFQTKLHSDMFKDTEYQSSYNQIWTRK